jgi:hypothetical protein
VVIPLSNKPMRDGERDSGLTVIWDRFYPFDEKGGKVSNWIAMRSKAG